MTGTTNSESMNTLRRALEQAPMAWSVVVEDAGTGVVLIDHEGHRVPNTASVGKLILLAFTGNQMLEDPGVAETRLDRRAVAPVSDSGIWQHLEVDTLSIADIARLIFIGSDNLGANVLLDHFGLERVRGFRAELGLGRTDLVDIVRDVRGPGDPEALSRGTAAELCGLMARVARGELVNPPLSRWLRDGLSLGMDLSMVPAPLGLDPLAHFAIDDNGAMPAVANKTGTDAGVRADAGLIRAGSRELAYAAICNYDAAGTKDIEVLELMHAIGRAILAELSLIE